MIIFLIKCILGKYDKIYLSVCRIDFEFIRKTFYEDKCPKKIHVFLNFSSNTFKEEKNLHFFVDDFFFIKFLKSNLIREFKTKLINLINLIFLKILVSYGRYKAIVSGSTGMVPFRKKPNKLHIHLVHSMSSLHTIYYNNSFYFYDYLFLVNNKQIDELKKLKEKDKQIKALGIKMGYGDFEYGDYKKVDRNNIRILIAPSWFHSKQFLFILENYILRNISNLNSIKSVIIRPHPGYSPNEIVQLKKIINKFKRKKIFLSNNLKVQEDFKESDLMITDSSGVGIQFALQKLAPSFFIIDGDRKQNNHFFINSNILSLERDLIHNFGKKISFKNKKNKLYDEISNYINSRRKQLIWKKRLEKSKSIYLEDSRYFGRKSNLAINELIAKNS